MGKVSGVQRQVLQLYRDFLRAARTKRAEARPIFEERIRGEFRAKQHHNRMDVIGIETMIRRGQKQLRVVQNPSCQAVSRVHVTLEGGKGNEK
eukprot:Nk52_evm2s2299 gene=Nk52_evmTU2s2299